VFFIQLGLQYGKECRNKTWHSQDACQQEWGRQYLTQEYKNHSETLFEFGIQILKRLGAAYQKNFLKGTNLPKRLQIDD
jgi:hypothetical protein